MWLVVSDKAVLAFAYLPEAMLKCNSLIPTSVKLSLIYVDDTGYEEVVYTKPQANTPS